MSAIPYAATRDGQMFALGVAYTAALAQSAFLVPDFSPRAKAPAKPRKPRKPSTRVLVPSLPLTNQPPAPPLPVPVALVGGHDSGPALTPRQVERLETSEQLGLLNSDGQRNLADWREREARKALRRKVKAVCRG